MTKCYDVITVIFENPNAIKC